MATRRPDKYDRMDRAALERRAQQLGVTPRADWSNERLAKAIREKEARMKRERLVQEPVYVRRTNGDEPEINWGLLLGVAALVLLVLLALWAWNNQPTLTARQPQQPVVQNEEPQWAKDLRTDLSNLKSQVQTALTPKTDVGPKVASPGLQQPEPQAAPPQQQRSRQETGQNKSLRFAQGDSVYGWKIVLDDGRTCDGGNCVLRNAPMAGTVTSGVVNPWDTEVTGKADSTFKMTNASLPNGQLPPAPAAQQPLAPQQPLVQQQQQTTTLYNLPPQPQVGHPSIYIETGVPCQNVPQGTSCTDVDAHTKTWVIQLLPGTTAVVGGFKVDGVTDGVYKAVAGPSTLNVTVTDGFVAVTKQEWANAEFCFRLGQAAQYSWARKTIQPLQGWNTCQ